MDSSAAPSLSSVPEPTHDEHQGTIVTTQDPFEQVRAQFLALIQRGDLTTPELSLGIFSTLQQIIRSQIGIIPRGNNLEEFFHSLVVPKEIEKSFRGLYEKSQRFLFSLVSAESTSIDEAPSPLWLEELDELINWTERRRYHLVLSEKYQLAEEGFFDSRIMSDVERQGEFGAAVKSCLNLDSRGGENLFLTMKVLWRGMPLKASESYAGWSEDETGHWLYELPLQTKGSRDVGRIIVDDLDIFIPYKSLLWGNEFSGRKTAEVPILISVLDRRGAVTISERIPTMLRVLHEAPLTSSVPLRSPMETGLVEFCPLKGHRIQNMNASIDDGMLRVSSDVTVFGVTGKDLQFDLRVLDSTGNTLHEEFYTLKPVTNIARFAGLGTAIKLSGLNLHPEQVVAPKQIELVIASDDGKVLCGGVVTIVGHHPV